LQKNLHWLRLHLSAAAFPQLTAQSFLHIHQIALTMIPKWYKISTEVREETQTVKLAAQRKSGFILAFRQFPSRSAISRAVAECAVRCAVVSNSPRVCSPIKFVASLYQ
jgi:ABC-type taurine transport system substrate-binding protein